VSGLLPRGRAGGEISSFPGGGKKNVFLVPGGKGKKRARLSPLSQVRGKRGDCLLDSEGNPLSPPASGRKTGSDGEYSVPKREKLSLPLPGRRRGARSLEVRGGGKERKSSLGGISFLLKGFRRTRPCLLIVSGKKKIASDLPHDHRGNRQIICP